MESIDTFYNKSIENGLCGRYSNLWLKCKNKKQFMDLALDANGISYVAESIAKGFITSKSIQQDFLPFINGKYIRHDESGFTSSIYVSPDAPITVRTTATIIADYNGEITVPKNMVCELHIANSEVKLNMLGERCVIHLYNANVVCDSCDRLNIISH
jgi:hypothetical protein